MDLFKPRAQATASSDNPTVVGESVASVRGSKSEGTKHDAGKPIFGAIPPFAELEVAKVMEFGCQKYSRGNWAVVDNLQERYMDAALRHLNAVRRGERLDDESGLSHLAHAACCVLFMLDDEMRGGK
jgi:hypothetical protein